MSGASGGNAKNTKKAEIMSEFFADIQSISNRIADELVTMAIAANGSIENIPKHDLAEFKASWVDLSVNNPTGLGAIKAEINKRIEKDPGLFSDEEKTEIQKKLMDQESAIIGNLFISPPGSVNTDGTKNEYGTPNLQGIQSLVLGGLRTQAIKSFVEDISKEKGYTLAEKASLIGAISKQEWSFSPEIVKSLSIGESLFASSVLRDQLKKNAIVSSPTKCAVNTEGLANDVRNAIEAKNTNKLSHAEQKLQFVKQIINIVTLGKKLDSKIISAASDALSGCDIPQNMFGDRDFRRKLSQSITKILIKPSKNLSAQIIKASNTVTAEYYKADGKANDDAQKTDEIKKPLTRSVTKRLADFGKALVGKRKDSKTILERPEQNVPYESIFPDDKEYPDFTSKPPRVDYALPEFTKEPPPQYTGKSVPQPLTPKPSPDKILATALAEATRNIATNSAETKYVLNALKESKIPSDMLVNQEFQAEIKQKLANKGINALRVPFIRGVATEIAQEAYVNQIKSSISSQISAVSSSNARPPIPPRTHSGGGRGPGESHA